MVRGTGKFKQKRGGGRSFSKDMVFDNSEQARAARRGEVEGVEEGSDEDSDEESEEESEEDSEEESGDETKPQTEMSRTERRDLKKKEAAARAAKKAGPSKGGDGDEEDDDEDLINPNHVQKKLTFKDLDAAPQLSRREREAKEKEEAKARYQKLHLAGKTDEAKSDMARLQKIRHEREAALARRKAEAEAKAKEVEEKRLAQMKRK